MALSDKRVLQRDPLTGLITYHQYDEHTDETVISYDAPTAPIIERNKILQNDPDHWKQGMKKDFAHYADIPVMVQMDWLINKKVDCYKQEDGKKMFSLLNDPDYRYLKVTTKVHVCKD
jgi:hypothetical protein